jgi:predicted RNase H-like HicB family nuclease
VDGKKLFCHAVLGEYEAQLLRNVNTEEKLNEARQQLKKALDAIIEHEKEEAAALQKNQDSQHIITRQFHLLLAMGRGFFHSLWGFIKSTKELSDLVNPFTSLSNALAAAWTAKRDDGISWVQSFSKNYSNEQHRELSEALGFDPKKVSREKLAEAYEIACFIYEDARSREILKNFADTYVEVQNIEEKMEFGGSVIFEIVLNALLIATTGGAGNAARVAVSSPLLKLLKSLEEALKNLSKWISNHIVKSTSHVKGMTGTSAVSVRIQRPKPIKLNPLGVDASAQAKRIEGIRSTLKSDLKRSGNMATADIQIDGQQTTMTAHSGIQNPNQAQIEAGLVGNANNTFKTFPVENKSGHMVERSGDSEAKILSNLANQLGSNNKANGTVTIFTERPPCSSCLSVAEQFAKRYPNIQVKIFDNAGNMLRPSQRP